MANYTPDQVTRLQQVHHQAIFQVKKQIQHWEKVNADYNSLAARLKCLPDKVTHEVMVPFGPLAFMPGQLIHTNELLVHMGDSWFADVSCKQGLKIIDHRLEIAQKHNEDLNKTLKNLEQKLEFTQELNNTGGESSFEIQEKVPEGYVHPGKKKRVSRVKPQPANAGSKHKTTPPPAPSIPPPAPSGAASCFNDEELMKRLDELEEQEEEEDELLLHSDDSLICDNTEENLSRTVSNQSTKTTYTFNKKKKVSWQPKFEITKGKEAGSDDSDEDSTIRIKIKHTKNQVKIDSLPDGIINSPADIGRTKVVSKVEVTPASISGDGNLSCSRQPKSILKGSRGDVNHEGAHDVMESGREHGVNEVVVSDTVREHSSRRSSAPSQPVSKKPVSRFKASRRK